MEKYLIKEEPINPSYINQIFELESKPTVFNRAEFINAKYEVEGLVFGYEINILEGFIRLRISIKYIQSGIESKTVLKVIDFLRGFRVVKVVDIDPKDLLVVLEYCISILNEELKEQKPVLKSLPKEFPIPIWEEHRELLEKMAKHLNGTISVP